MDKKALIFLPSCLDFRKSGFIKGFHKYFSDCEAYYITSYKVFTNYSSGCVGFIGKKITSPHNSKEHFLHINNLNDCISVSGKVLSSNFVQITYDYYGFKKSGMLDLEGNYGRHFQILSNILQSTEHSKEQSGVILKLWKQFMLINIYIISIILWVLSKMVYICTCSATFQNLKEILESLKMSLKDLYYKGSNPIICNSLSAKLIDMLLGILALNYFLMYESYIVEAIQEIISNLKELLLCLMGSPIGLKLNHAFNKSLAQFFFYHISLWKVFLLSLRPILNRYFRYLVLPGALGLSFQIAMILDIISIATFHVYCIYVYAARLFNLQLRGLISLWRLFIGKKYNPLRDRIDSCQYSPNQLFIGTLGFTVLLFLLPTTVMYYTVFSMFRLMILSVDGILLRSISILKAIPLYTFVLWIKRSSSLAGSLCMTWKINDEDSIAKIEVRLNILPLMQCIRSSMPTKTDTSKSFGNIFHSLITGTLL